MCNWVIYLRWGLCAFLVGLIIWVIVIIAQAVRKHREESRFNLGQLLIGVGGMIISIIGLTVDFQSLCEDAVYRLRITSPQSGGAVTVQDNGRGAAQLQVFGTSRKVAEDTDLYVYILVHPVVPYAEGWWIAPPVRPDPSGWWRGTVWIGSEQVPIQVGHKFELVAAVAPAGRDQMPQPISDPDALAPLARSHSVQFSITEVQQVTPTPTSTPTPTPTPTITPTPTETPTPTPTPTETPTPSPTPTPTPLALAVADFDACNSTNALGGGMGAAYDPNTANRLDVTYPQESGRGCIARLQYGLEEYGWAAFWLQLNGANFSSYNTLYFWARGEAGIPAPGTLKVELKRANNSEMAVVYLSVSLTPQWQRFSVPLGRFGLSSRTLMSELVFTFEAVKAGQSGVILLDRIYIQE